MEIQFDKTSASTELMIIQFEPDSNVTGFPTVSSWIDYSKDKIYQSLSAATQDLYRAAAYNSYVKITASDYTNIQTTVTGITKAGVTDALYTSIGNSTNFSAGSIAFTNIVAASTPAVLANTYIFAIKFFYNGTNSNIRFYSNNSTSSYTNFTQIGGNLPQVTQGDNYFILKGASNVRAATDGNFAAWTESNLPFGAKPFVANGVNFLTTSTPITSSSILSGTLGNGNAFAMQALTTSNIQWVTL